MVDSTEPTLALTHKHPNKGTYSIKVFSHFCVSEGLQTKCVCLSIEAARYISDDDAGTLIL